MFPSPVMTRRAALAFAACASLGALAACWHVQLISSYDEVSDRAVTELQTKVDTLLSQLDADPTPAYASLTTSYESIRGDIASLRLRNEARPKNTLTVRQIDELSAVFAQLEAQHRAQTLNQAMVGPSRDALRRTFLAILKLELAKKELKE